MNTAIRTNTAVLMACFNRRHVTMGCLHRLLKEQQWLPKPLDVYLLDDASPDGTGAAVRQAFPKVKVIYGDGSRFWCGGMRLAWQEAAKRGPYDFYIWLNDDTLLYRHAVKSLFDTYFHVIGKNSAPTMVVGSICDPEHSTYAYGGMTWESQGLRIVSRLMIPDGRPKRCDTMNGNFVLIPQDVFGIAGHLSKTFRHGIGDFEYGLRARQLGCHLWATGEYMGTCPKNTSLDAWYDSSLSIRQRMRRLFSHKGMPPYQYLAFVRRYGGPLWPITVAKLFGRMLFPSFWEHRKRLRQRT